MQQDMRQDMQADTLPRRPAVRPQPAASATSDAMPDGPSGGGLVARAMGWVRRHKRIVQALALLLIATFVALAINKSWSALMDYHWDVQWGLLALGFVFFIAQ